MGCDVTNINLINDEPALRLAVAKVLEPNVEKCCATCGKVKTCIAHSPDDLSCWAFPSATDPLEMLVQQMLRKVHDHHAFEQLIGDGPKMFPRRVTYYRGGWLWWVFDATPDEQLVVLVAAVTGERT